MINYLKNYFRKIYINRKHFVEEKGKKLFSVRKSGGATSGRAETFFTKEPMTVEWIKNFKHNSNFLDIGANIGIYSLYAATKKINVVSFEPESSNFHQLNLNIFDNSLQHVVKAYPFCAGSKLELGNLNLNTFKTGGSGHNFISNNNIKSEFENNIYNQGTIAISVDKFIEISNFIPNYIKIDVDGNEDSVIKGMVKTMKNDQLKSILIEIDENNRSHKDCVDLILGNNFKISNRETYVNKLGNYIFIK